MRLLDSASIKLHEFIGRGIPKYVILSHTWGQEEDTFQDFQDLEKAKKKRGFQKLEGCCRRAQSDGFKWVWIDTCCIDKSSSSELSEAINSMYQWYQESQICYAYLEDITPRSTLPPRMPDLRNSRWFRRGWTLQELIAPPIVEFYDRNWFEVGTKLSLLGTIAAITRIDIRVLENSQRLDSINVASRMSWASERKTTRKEDEAYCLMGIFGVNMPLLYGEGHRAFHRLQEEIMKIHDDYTLFAWTVSGTRLTDHATYPRQSLPAHGDGILAASPAAFQDISPFSALPWWPYSDLYSTIFEALSTLPHLKEIVKGEIVLNPPTLTCRGLSISVPIRRLQQQYQVCLTCTRHSTNVHFLCLILQSSEKPPKYGKMGGRTFTTTQIDRLQFLSRADIGKNLFEYATIYLTSSSDPNDVKPSYWWSRPLHSLKVVTDGPCSVVGSLLFWKDDPSEVWSRLYSFSLSENSNRYILDSPPHDSDLSIQAMFKIRCQSDTISFIIAFGTVRNGVPWCAAIFQPPNDFANNFEPETKKLLAPELNPKIDRTSSEDWEAVSKLFEVRSTESPHCLASSVISRGSSNSNLILKLFKNTSDRTTGHLQGFIITATARRTFDEVVSEAWVLKISASATQP